MPFPIYLDYAATTPVDPRVAEPMARHLALDGVFGNPASSHAFGQAAAQAVEKAREQVAALVNADPEEIVWTSGATESNNLAIKGAAHYHRKKGRHIVTCKTEHRAVLDPCRQLEREGWQVTYLDPEPNGLLDPDRLAAALRDDTVLVSVMHVNNEIGVIQDLAAIGQLTRRRGILLHTDAAQSAGKVVIDLRSLPVDLMSLSAHKLYGPKGIGALYVRRRPRVRLEAQLQGGGQERGLRAGTLATHQIVGMGEAFRLARAEMRADNERLGKLRERLWEGLRPLGEVYLNGDPERRVAPILNVSFSGVAGEALLTALRDIALSSGSACTSADPEPSHVLRAIGRSDRLARSAVRFSLGRFTTPEEIDITIERVQGAVTRLRELSPLWEPPPPPPGRGSIRFIERGEGQGEGQPPPVLTHFDQPCNAGAFAGNEPGVATGTAGTPAEGEIIRLQIKVDERGVIIDARFKAHGGVATIAAGSLVSEWVKGKTLDAARALDDTRIAEALALAPLSIRSAVLAEDALRAALADYERHAVNSKNFF